LLRGYQRVAIPRTGNNEREQAASPGIIKVGINIVHKALSWPARLIAINAGEDGSVVVGKILERVT
jgi:chaperonin GroEL (HSP60 family)